MAHHALRLFPDPILRKKVPPVAHFDASLDAILRKLGHVMSAERHGIGIAAPQAGISKQIAIVDVSSRISGAERLILINPEILELSEPRASREGCMSMPDYTATVARFNAVRFRWQDARGEWHEKVSTGIEAICVQHEVDHLQGKLFFDRVSSLKRDMVPRPMDFLRRPDPPRS